MKKHWAFKDLNDEDETCKDFIQKLNETNQIYIVGHDVPLSISKHLYTLLNEKRIELAKQRGVPEEQFEWEDFLFECLRCLW